MKSTDILIALTRSGGPFCRRQYVCVPNVYWGWDLRYEADLIAVSKARRCAEIEIKISRGDLRADALKYKWKRGLDARISRFYYAVPNELQEFALTCIPPNAGLISVREGTTSTAGLPVAKIVRTAEVIRTAIPVTDPQINGLQRLGAMRYWDLLIKEGDR